MNVLGIIEAVIDLVRQAVDGDEEAAERLNQILPDELQVDAVAAEQDDLDEGKFGPRS